MQTVYDKDGKAYERDSVDCREYLATGRYFTEPPAPKPKPKAKTESLPHPFVEAETKPKKAATKK